MVVRLSFLLFPFRVREDRKIWGGWNCWGGRNKGPDFLHPPCNLIKYTPHVIHLVIKKLKTVSSQIFRLFSNPYTDQGFDAIIQDPTWSCDWLRSASRRSTVCLFRAADSLAAARAASLCANRSSRDWRVRADSSRTYNNMPFRVPIRFAHHINHHRGAKTKQ